MVADQAGGRAMSKNLRSLNKTAALRKRRGGKRGIR
nr:MAG TPA: hypothetical protein [Caudoviricetes sp.]